MADVLVPVEILGQTYPIRSGLDARYVEELATHVDEKMRAASEVTPSGDSLRLAVVAALNIADEYFRCVATREDQATHLTGRLDAIERLIDDALQTDLT
jgi:cell division protein ZapA